jgi:hypothetical protein
MTASMQKISSAISEIACKQEAKQIAHSNELDAKGVVAWIPDGESNGHGIGWFLYGDKFVAYRKYSNGWAMNHIAVMDAELVRVLHKALP